LDVCIISENSYPVSFGGVSEWCKNLIEKMGAVDFQLFTLAPDDKIKYKLPKNITKNIIIKLNSPDFKNNDYDYSSLLELLHPILKGKKFNCVNVSEYLKDNPIKAEEILASQNSWDWAIDHYNKKYRSYPFMPFYFSWISLFYLLYKVFELCDQIPNSDVYHSLNAGYAGLLGSIKKIRSKRPLITTEHGLYLKERLFELSHSEVPVWLREFYNDFFISLVKTTYHHSDVITSVCADHVKYQKKIDSKVDPIVVYNGIDYNKYEYVENYDRDKYSVGTISRITPIKDTLTFIRTANEVIKKYPTKFYVIGEVQDQEYYEECKELVDDLDIGQYVEFTGFQDSTEWYPKLDVFVLPSLSEGFPLTILEALSTGTPCLATNVGGVSEILDKELLVNKWAYDKLAKKIIKLLKSPERRQNLGKQGRILVEKKFGLNKMVSNYQNIYKEVLN